MRTIPEDAVLPDDLIQEMKLIGKLEGPAKNRVRSIQLRGELSQGHLYSGYRIKSLKLGEDAAQALGITKWEHPVPVHMGGPTEHGPSLTYDIENMKSWPNTLRNKEKVVVTEKIHGTFCCLGYRQLTQNQPQQIIVASKGNLKRGQRFSVYIPRNETNLYVRVWFNYEDVIKTTVLASKYTCMMFLGEIFGPQIQDLTYGVNNPTFRLFDIWADGDYLDWDDLQLLATQMNLHAVPEIWRGPWSGNVTIEHGSGKSLIASHMREGIVVRPLQERYDSGTPDGYSRGPGRVIFKVVSEEYLLRQHGTEYN